MTDYTLLQWIREYVDMFRKPNISDYYYRSIKTYLKHIPPDLANKSLSAVTWIDLQKLMNDLGVCRTRDELYNLIKAALIKAERLELIAKNPIYVVEIKKSRRKLRNAMPVDHQRFIETALIGTKYELPLLLILYTGVRPNEFRRMQRSDLDFERGVIYVRGTKTENAERYTFLPDVLREPLRTRPEGRLFVHTAKTLNRALRAVCDSLGLPRYTLYNLRHTYATRLYEAGVPDAIIQFTMGHSTIDFTKSHYIHMLSDFVRSQQTTVSRALTQ